MIKNSEKILYMEKLDIFSTLILGKRLFMRIVNFYNLMNGLEKMTRGSLSIARAISDSHYKRYQTEILKQRKVGKNTT